MRKVNWGVLGTANIAKSATIPGMLLADNVERVAIAGRSLEKAQKFQQEFGFRRAYGSYEALLADEEIEAVYIPLPNQLHYEWTIKALQAKKHVLCEKPMAPTPELAEEMARTAQENGVFLMEAFAYLHSPLTNAIREDLRQGVIGDVVYMENAFLISDCAPTNIRMKKENYGGGVYDVGCYCTSQMLWLLEDEPKTVQAVAAFSEAGVDHLANAVLTFADGKRASFTCGMTLPPKQNRRIDRLMIHGTKGILRCDAQFNQCGVLRYTVYADGRETEKTVSVPNNYQLEVEQLGRCIRNGEKPYVSNEFSIRNSRLLERVLQKMGY